MQTNQSSERKKKPFLWIILVVAVLLAGAFALYSRHMRALQPQVPTPVVARGKVPLQPPLPPVDSSDEPSTSAEPASSTETDTPENASATFNQSEPESTPAASADTDPHESAPELKSKIAAPPQKDSTDDTGQALVDDAEQTGPKNARPATTAAAEPQNAVRETPESPPSSDTVASPPSDLPATSAEPTPTPIPSDATVTAAPFTIQVGAYRTKNNAERQLSQLREKGFEAYLYEKIDKEQRAWYFVRFGRFEDFGSAEKALASFKKQEKMEGAIVRSN